MNKGKIRKNKKYKSWLKTLFMSKIDEECGLYDKLIKLWIEKDSNYF